MNLNSICTKIAIEHEIANLPNWTFRVLSDGWGRLYNGEDTWTWDVWRDTPERWLNATKRIIGRN